jgi:hypothetical protein
MGTYNLTTKEIIEAIDDALDNLEGDFTQKQLFQALKKLKEYPYVADKFIDETKWVLYIDSD